MKYFLSGASGELGGMIARLFPKDEQLILGTRKPKNTTVFDYDDEDAMAASLKGSDCLLFISSNAEDEYRIDQHKRVVNACVRAKISRLVYLSFITAKFDKSYFVFSNSHKITEEYIKKSGIKSVFIRSNWYMDNLKPSLDQLKSTQSFFAASGSGRLAFIAKEDVAKSMIAAALAKDPKQSYEISGAKAISLPELAQMLSSLLKSKISYTAISVKAMEDEYLKSGLPPFLAKALALNDIGVDRGEYLGDSSDFLDLCGFSPKSMEDFLKSYF